MPSKSQTILLFIFCILLFIFRTLFLIIPSLLFVFRTLFFFIVHQYLIKRVSNYFGSSKISKTGRKKEKEKTEL